MKTFHKISTSDLAESVLNIANKSTLNENSASVSMREAARRLHELDGQASVLCGLLADCFERLDPMDEKDYQLRLQIDAAVRGAA